MFEVRLVPTFVAIAKHKHFGRAAVALNTTQPGVSQQLSKLERQLKAKLVARTRRSVELTQAGETFLALTHRLLPLLHRMEEDTRSAAAGLLGKVSLGFSSSIIYSDVPARISAFTEAVTGIELGFRVYGGDELKALLDSGEIDAIITTLPMESEDYWSVPIATQAMGVAIHPRHPLANRQRLTLADLKDEPFIVVPREQHPVNHDALIAGFRELGATLRVSAYEISFPNVLARVAVGEGVGFVALGYRGNEAAGVRVIDLDDPVLSKTWIHAVARRDNLRDVTRRLIEGLAVALPPRREDRSRSVGRRRRGRSR
jgi:DNA-binding transcriptional LysR family regulator